MSTTDYIGGEASGSCEDSIRNPTNQSQWIVMKQRATQSRATMALSILLLFFLLAGTSQAQHLSSPNGRLQLDVALTQRGQPTYTLSLEDRVVIQESQLGIELSGTRSLVDGFSVFNVTDWHTNW